jgi:L-ascorbate metabolism protein UlaG (beta-lactamase superfamily)
MKTPSKRVFFRPQNPLPCLAPDAKVKPSKTFILTCMTIQFFGVSCFKISTKFGNEEVSIVTDPYASKVGKLPRNLAGDIVTVSRLGHDHHNNLEAIGGEHFLIEHPGEYESKGIPVYGIPATHEKPEDADYHKNTMYHLIVDDMHVVHLGGCQHPLTDEQLAQLGEVDVLMVPVGGGDVLDAAAAADLVSRMEPRLVIPMHFSMSDLNLKAADVKAFIKETGLKAEETDKLKIAKKDLPQDDTRLVVMKIA